MIGGDIARIINQKVNAAIFGQPELGMVTLYCKYDFNGKLIAVYLDEEAAQGINLLNFLAKPAVEDLELEAENIFNERSLTM